MSVMARCYGAWIQQGREETEKLGRTRIAQWLPYDSGVNSVEQSSYYFPLCSIETDMNQLGFTKIVERDIEATRSSLVQSKKLSCFKSSERTWFL